MVTRNYSLPLEPLNDSTDFPLYADGDSVKRNWDALYQSVETILRVTQGTAFFHASLGGALEDSLFVKLDPQLAFILEGQMSALVEQQEPRLSRANITITLDEDAATHYLDMVLVAKDGSVSPAKRYILSTGEQA